MKNSKKILTLILILVIAFTLSACGAKVDDEDEVGNSTQETNIEEDNKNNEKKDDDPTQEELNDKLKEEAKEFRYIEVFRDEVEKDTKIHIEGVIDAVIKDDKLGEYSVIVEEDDMDVEGVYDVKSFVLEEFFEGDRIKVWGSYDGKNDIGAPTINATIIEKQ